MSPEEAMLAMKLEPFEELGYAKVDTHRGLRQGAIEVIFGQNKTVEQIEGIAKAMIARGETNILITRLSENAAKELSGKIPMEYHSMARIAVANPAEVDKVGSGVIASGGTSDIPV